MHILPLFHAIFFTLKSNDSQKSWANYFHNDIKAFNFSWSWHLCAGIQTVLANSVILMARFKAGHLTVSVGIVFFATVHSLQKQKKECQYSLKSFFFFKWNFKFNRHQFLSRSLKFRGTQRKHVGSISECWGRLFAGVIVQMWELLAEVASYGQKPFFFLKNWKTDRLPSFKFECVATLQKWTGIFEW